MSGMRSRHVSRVIPCAPERVYAFASDPDNLPIWARGLASAEIRRDGDVLVVDSPMGEVRVEIVARNDYGVLDHDVTLPTGAVVTNPMRVVAHPGGCEVIFTVRQLDLTDHAFDRDCQAVADDLERLQQAVTGEL